MFNMISDGCTARPVAVSVAAKQASKMLVLLWSLRRLFTAIITNTLSTTVKGQVIALMMVVMMVIIILASCGTFRVSCCTVISVTFVKLNPDRLAIFRKASKGELTSRIARGFLFAVFLIYRYIKCNMCFPLTFPMH